MRLELKDVGTDYDAVLLAKRLVFLAQLYQIIRERSLIGAL